MSFKQNLHSPHTPPTLLAKGIWKTNKQKAKTAEEGIAIRHYKVG